MVSVSSTWSTSFARCIITKPYFSGVRGYDRDQEIFLHFTAFEICGRLVMYSAIRYIELA